MLDEVSIIRQVLDGNTNSFSLLVDAYRDMVFSLIVKVVKNVEEAEEAAQDTFIKAFSALGSFKNESKFSTWLFRIAYNTAISRARKKTITTSAIDDYVLENFSIDTVQDSLDAINEYERIRLLNLAIENLDADEQLLINLFYYNQQSIDDISVITGLTGSNVKVKMHRTRKKMYAFMQSRLNKVKVRPH
jgi:RNA polymerase sigma-70 factor (ECF subfamily)